MAASATREKLLALKGQIPEPVLPESVAKHPESVEPCRKTSDESGHYGQYYGHPVQLWVALYCLGEQGASA